MKIFFYSDAPESITDCL